MGQEDTKKSAYVFQQDGAPTLTAKTVQDCLDANKSFRF